MLSFDCGASQVIFKHIDGAVMYDLPLQRCQPLRKNHNFSDFNLQTMTLRCDACLLPFLEMSVKLHFILT